MDLTIKNQKNIVKENIDLFKSYFCGEKRILNSFKFLFSFVFSSIFLSIMIFSFLITLLICFFLFYPTHLPILKEIGSFLMITPKPVLIQYIINRSALIVKFSSFLGIVIALAMNLEHIKNKKN